MLEINALNFKEKKMLPTISLARSAFIYNKSDIESSVRPDRHFRSGPDRVRTGTSGPGPESGPGPGPGPKKSTKGCVTTDEFPNVATRFQLFFL